MWGLRFFKKRTNKKPKKISVSQTVVLRSIGKLQPCHYRQISQDLHVIEGCVTPRIAELRRKGLVKVAYQQVGPSKVRVNYYRLTAKGTERLRDVA